MVAILLREILKYLRITNNVNKSSIVWIKAWVSIFLVTELGGAKKSIIS